MIKTIISKDWKVMTDSTCSSLTTSQSQKTQPMPWNFNGNFSTCDSYIVENLAWNDGDLGM